MQQKIKEIKEKFESLVPFNQEAIFECYDENIATYHVYDDDGCFHEFRIMNENTSYFKTENIYYLLELDDILFLSYSFYMKKLTKNTNDFERMFNITFRIVDTDEYKKQEKQKTQN